MIEKLVSEYTECAEKAIFENYADKISVRRFNELSERMRDIVDEIKNLGDEAIWRFTSVLDTEPASSWAAFHLVEKTDLDPVLLAKCFACVEREKERAEAENRSADAFGIKMWLKEWRNKKYGGVNRK